MVPGNPSSSAPRSLRILIGFLSVILTFLFIWLLGFLMSDIGDIPGPDFSEIEKRHVDAKLLDETKSINEREEAINNQINRQEEIQQTLRQSMDNARLTMDKMMDLHRLGLEKGVSPTAEQQDALAQSQSRFLEAQREFESANSQIAVLTQERFELSQRRDLLNRRIEDQRKPANEEYHKANRRHEFIVASLKLALIVPLFLIAAYMVVRRRDSMYRPIFVAALVATFWKIGVVMFEHFPREFFKYIAIAAAILITLGFLARLLRSAARPRQDELVKRHREGYIRHRCPVCAYPIRRGPLRFAVWGRKGPLALGSGENDASGDKPYTCPSCGTRLYEVCGHCGEVRPSLLPNCESCGAETPIL